ncbi:MAG: ACT domain-containing protein [Gammaproteobacteria bacterium]
MKDLRPSIHENEFVYLSLSPDLLEATGPWRAFAQLHEVEGVTLVVTAEDARSRGFEDTPAFRCITLGVHSALEEVGLTAAVSGVLARHGIAANILAGFHHDHVLVPAERGDEALELLRKLSDKAACYALARPVAGSNSETEE